MKLKKIKLENIRSYLKQEIEFPEGSVLLSGDIGSGKSSVLLAIDFALFGLRRSSLSGGSLLRSGEKNGSVELFMEIDNRMIVIKRGLKRNGSVVQDSGYVIINGIKKEGTAVELKRMVLDLLNYPRELLTKSKSLIFRYTVYTPQEEMKSILIGDKDLRLDTLRKVFGLDKYKLIRENCEKFNYALRERRKEYLGFISDLETKEKEKKERGEKIEKLRLKVREILPGLNEVKEVILKKKSETLEIEEGINRVNFLKKELEVGDVDLKNKNEFLEKNNDDLLILEDQIRELGVIEDIEVGDFKLKIVERERKLIEFEDQMNEYNDRLSEFRFKKENSERIKKDISELDVCFVCKQMVKEEHKNKIIRTEDERLKKLKEIEDVYLKKKAELVREISVLNEEVKELKERERKVEIVKLKNKSFEEKRKKIDKVLSINNKLRDEIIKIKKKREELLIELKKFDDFDERYKGIRKEIDELNDREKQLEIEKSMYEREIIDLEEFLLKLIKEIEEKNKIKEKLGFFNEVGDWLEKMFLNLMLLMEKKIMLKTYADFNDLFRKWFGILVEDENLKIELDEEYTPRIEQNGYEIDYGFLSGGEKTAAALAYRLSLNQVINNLMSGIKTKDLLILDEPTDGFSDEQLERMKIVLDELELKQIIIVSHESKIESFVDEVLRFDKKEHVSRVQ